MKENIWRIAAFSTLYLLAFFGLRLAGSSAALGAVAVLAAAGIAISVRDLSSREIPDTATLAIALVGAWSLTQHPENTWLYLSVAGSLLALFWGMSTFAYHWRDGREALGLGDVKLMGAMVVCLGPVPFAFALFAASVAGIFMVGLQGLRRMNALGGEESDREVPFGPFLAYANFILFQMSLSFP